MRLEAATFAGSADRPSEDWLSATANLTVVLDGQTARTDTGCSHGVAWFTAQLGGAIVATAGSPDVPLTEALASAIDSTARLHPECDLTNPATPGAAVAVVRLGEQIEYLVLGDVTIVLDKGRHLQVVVDDRVDATAVPERRYVDRHPIGSQEKAQGLLRMKQAELMARNHPEGFWVAAADVTAATHAIAGTIPTPSVRRLAVMTDGAARLVTLFHAATWRRLLNALDTSGPRAILRRVRAIEETDPAGVRWPRNKRSDDASLVYLVLGDAQQTANLGHRKPRAGWRPRRR